MKVEFGLMVLTAEISLRSTPFVGSSARDERVRAAEMRVKRITVFVVGVTGLVGRPLQSGCEGLR